MAGTVDKETLSKRGRKSRRKGKSFEQEIARNLRDLYPEAKRGWQSRGGTKEAPDVDHTPFYIECKREVSTNPKKAWQQAQDGTDGRPAVAICKDDHGPVLVTLEFSVFKSLLGAAKNWSDIEKALEESGTITLELANDQEDD